MTVVGIVGSRHFSDYEAFSSIVVAHLVGVTRIVSGGFLDQDNGVDAMARRFADWILVGIIYYIVGRLFS